MPRLKGKVPSYCLHKRSGRAVVRLNGKDHYLGEYGSPSSQEEYQRLIQAWLATNQAQARIAAKGSLPSEELPLPSSFSPSSMSQLAELHPLCRHNWAISIRTS